MRVEQLAVTLPSRRVTNDEVVDDIASRSKGFKGDLGLAIRKIKRMLALSGANTRSWVGPGETTLDLTVRACEEAMRDLGSNENIDLLICASVFQELSEPATANLLANKLGLMNIECFDVKEACDGWMKAVKIASAFIESGMYRRVMIVNGEFPMTRGFGIYPELFKISSLDELEWRFPGFTLGEAATAMIVGPGNGKWDFRNVTRNDLFDLCSITMPWYKPQDGSSPRLAKDGPGIFTSFGVELRAHGFPLAVSMFKDSGINPDEVDVLFTHSSSKADWRHGARDVGLGNKIYDIYATCGNVVSAAVPAAMAIAANSGSLLRGHRVATWIASAGMSFSTASFEY